MGGANIGVGHDRGVVLERIANVAVLIRVLADGVVVELIGVGQIVVPLVAIVFPRNGVRDQAVTDTRERRRRDGKHCVVGVGVGESILAIPKVSGVVVVEKVVVALFTVGSNGCWKRLQVIHD